MLALLERQLGGGDDLVLPAALVGVGELEAVGGDVASLAGLALGAKATDQAVDTARDAFPQSVEVDLDALAFDRIATDLDQDQLDPDRSVGCVLGFVEQIGVERGLFFVELAGGRRQLGTATNGFDLLDDQTTVGVAPQTVDPPLDGDFPATVLEAVLD